MLAFFSLAATLAGPVQPVDDLATWSRGRLEECHSAAVVVGDWSQDLDCLEELLRVRPGRTVLADHHAAYAAYQLDALEQLVRDLEARPLAADADHSVRTRRVAEHQALRERLARVPDTGSPRVQGLRARAERLTPPTPEPRAPTGLQLAAPPPGSVGSDAPGPAEGPTLPVGDDRARRPRRLLIGGSLGVGIGTAMLGVMISQLIHGAALERRERAYSTTHTGKPESEIRMVLPEAALVDEQGRLANRAAVGTAISGGVAVITGAVILILHHRALRSSRTQALRSRSGYTRN